MSYILSDIEPYFFKRYPGVSHCVKLDVFFVGYPSVSYCVILGVFQAIFKCAINQMKKLLAFKPSRAAVAEVEMITYIYQKHCLKSLPFVNSKVQSNILVAS